MENLRVLGRMKGFLFSLNGSVERWLVVKLQETEKLYSHPNRSFNSMEIIG